MPPPTDHECPRPACRARVPRSRFACRLDWYALSVPVRQAIYATAHLSILDPTRRDALKAAREEWSN